jgi:hypothetical protein
MRDIGTDEREHSNGSDADQIVSTRKGNGQSLGKPG